MFKCSDKSIPVNSGCFDNMPIVESVTKSEKNYNAWTLRYVAMKICKENGVCADYELSFEQIDDMNATQDSELYLGNFEGIEINGYIFRTLFVNEDNRIFATVEEKNEDGETTNDFIVLVD